MIVNIDFFISPAYLRAADQDGPLGEVHHDESPGLGAVPGRVGLHLRSVEHREGWREAGQLRGRPDEHADAEDD